MLGSAFLMLSFVIMGGCLPTRHNAPTPAYRCDKPGLLGPTWADLAILSVEQAAAIDVCNIRNGVDVYERKLSARSIAIPTPTPVECGDVGVQVPYDTPPNGVIRSENLVDISVIARKCGSGDIGCAVPRPDGAWDIYHQGTGWVLIHERCHAKYNSTQHTLDYLATRRILK